MDHSHQVHLTKWLVAAFGESSLRDLRQRAQRVLEEAVELAQAVGIEEDRALAQVTHTYARPPGEIGQEIAGVLNTVMLAAEGYGQDAMWLARADLRRAWREIETIKRKQADKVQP